MAAERSELIMPTEQTTRTVTVTHRSDPDGMIEVSTVENVTASLVGGNIRREQHLTTDTTVGDLEQPTEWVVFRQTDGRTVFSSEVVISWTETEDDKDDETDAENE
jgi:hypothetical protein